MDEKQHPKHKGSYKFAITYGIAAAFMLLVVVAMNSLPQISADTTSNTVINTCVSQTTRSTQTVSTLTDQEKTTFGANAVAYDAYINGTQKSHFRVVLGAQVVTPSGTAGNAGTVKFTLGLTFLGIPSLPSITSWGNNGDSVNLGLSDRSGGISFKYNSAPLNKIWTGSQTADIADFANTKVYLSFDGLRHDGCVTEAMNLATALNTTSTQALTADPASLTIPVGQTSHIKIGGSRGSVSMTFDPDPAGAVLGGSNDVACTAVSSTCVIDFFFNGLKDGQTTLTLKDADGRQVAVPITIGAGTGATPAATATVGTASTTISLQPGYNAISIPDSVGPISTEELFSSTKTDLVGFNFNFLGGKAWWSSEAGDIIDAFYPGMGYYIYNKGVATTVSITKAAAANKGIPWIRPGWNLLSNSTTADVKLADANFTVARSTGAGIESLSTLLTGDPATRPGYGTIFIINDPHSSDAATAFTKVDVDSTGVGNVTIPAGKDYWFYLFQ